MARTILIIEDDKEINGLLYHALSAQGYVPQSSYTGMDGLNKLHHETYDLVLLDIMLPYKSGDQILRELRTFSNVPVLIISAKDTTQNKIDLLQLGADDYITKPFDIDELLARVEANLRRSQSVEAQVATQLTYKDIQLDTSTKQVFVNKQSISLTATEFHILEIFLTTPGKVFSKANLFESLWNEEYSVDDNTLNVHISRLRQKLKAANEKEEYIETLWGLGYRLIK